MKYRSPRMHIPQFVARPFWSPRALLGDTAKGGRRHSRRDAAKLRFRVLSLETLQSRELFAADSTLEVATAALAATDTRGARVQQILLGSSTSPANSAFRNGVQVTIGANQLQPYTWSKIDTVSIVFDENVQVSSSQLQLIGGNAPQVATFSYNAQTFKAIWKFDTPLTSGKYLLNLTDRITDLSGNRLDGEWLDGTSQISGNASPGGELNFRFDVHIGDVDSDGEVTVRDLAVLESNFGANGNLKFDINMSGGADAADSAILSSNFGDSLPPATLNETLLVKSIYATGTANPRYAVIGVDQQGNQTLSVINAIDGQIKSTRTLDRNIRYVELEPVSRNGTLESIAVLGVNRATGDVRLWFYNPTLSGAVPSMNFGRTWIPMDLEVLYNSTQEPRIAILGTQNAQPYANRIWWADPLTLQSPGSLSLGTNFEAQKFVVTPASGTTPALISILGLLPSNRTMRVKTFNSITGALVANIALTGSSVVDFKQGFDPVRNEPLIIALSSSAAGSADIEVRTLQGTLRRKLSLPIDGVPKALAVWNKTALSPLQFAVLTEVGAQREGIVLTGDLLTTQPARKISFGAGFRNVGLLTLSMTSADDVELSVTQTSDDLGAAQIKLRSARTGISYRTIPTKVFVRNSDFFDQNRVHAHTPLSEVDERLGLARSWFETPESDNAAALLSDMGANVFTRHVKTGDEDPWWPSNWPSDGSGTSIYAAARDNQGIALDAGQNLAQDYINEAIANDTPMIGYYFDATEQNLSVAHPEWVCKAFNGVPLTPHPTKGAYLDVTGAYGDVVKNRLLEIANMGASGVYLDFRHLPAGGCWGTQLASDFQATYGIPAPAVGSSAAYVKFMQFQAQRVTETLQGWKDAVAAQYPYFHFVISVTSVPGLTRIDMSSDMAAIDSPKSEFNLATQRGQNNSVFFNNQTLYEPDASIRMAFGWTLMREVATKSIPHIWNALTPNRDQLLSFVSAVDAYGMIAAVHVVEELLEPGHQVAGIASRDDLMAAIDLGNKLSPQLAGTEPTKWMAVHFPEAARDSYGTNSKLAWEKVLLPAVAAFQAGVETGRPVSVINDDILTAGIPNDFKVLYLPNTTSLTAAQLANVTAFKNRGGVVISNDGLTQWGQAAGFRSGVNQIESTITALSTPVEFLGLPARVQAVAHSHETTGSDGRIVLAVLNDFSYVQGSTIFEPIAANMVNPTPAPVPAGIRAVLKLADWPQLTAANTQIVAVDPLTLARIPVTRTSTTLEIVFPQFAQSSWVVIEAIPSSSSAPLAMTSASPITSLRTNTALPEDVNGDGQVSPSDALAVIIALNFSRSNSDSNGEGEAATPLLVDVNGDSQVTPLDALLVINYLAQKRTALGEGELNQAPQTPNVETEKSASNKFGSVYVPIEPEVFDSVFADELND